MTSTAKLIKALSNQPDLPLAVQELQLLMDQEKAKRAAYYALVHEDLKAEFINGTIVYQSPVRRRHWRVSMRLSARLSEYVESNSLGEVGAEKVMISLTRNDYEPDIVFFGREKAALFSDDQMHFPAPDFIVEILSKSTEAVDRGVKFQDYAAHGVMEYWIVYPEEESVEQYLLDGEIFKLHQKLTNTGMLTARVIEHFELDIQDLFRQA